MKPELKTKWIEALKSGKYKQAVGSLKVEHPMTGEKAYCCLGVLCDISGIEFKSKKSYYGNPKTIQYTLDEEYIWSGMIPPSDLNKLGLTDSVAGTLAEKNDSGVPFTKIADYIEEHL